LTGLPHNFSVKKAHYAQFCLSKLVIHEDKLPSEVRLVGGVDVAYVGDVGISAAVVLDYKTLEPIETAVATCPVKMPYVLTLLSFRELPPAMAAVRRLKLQPDVFLVDAQGWAHPYRCGFACHLGLSLGKPTVGVAKSRLVGEPTEVDGRTVLVDKGEIIGELVTTKEDTKPVYVSIGHMVTLETAAEIVRHCSRSRIPEPTLHAHNLATITKQQLSKKVISKEADTTLKREQHGRRNQADSRRNIL
jgi:deoxyribonuclease V